MEHSVCVNCPMGLICLTEKNTFRAWFQCSICKQVTFLGSARTYKDNLDAIADELKKGEIVGCPKQRDFNGKACWRCTSGVV